MTREEALQNLDLARQLIEPIRELAGNIVTVDDAEPVAGAIAAPWITPTLADETEQAIEHLQAAYVELNDTDGDGGALESGTMPTDLLSPNPRGRIG